MPLIFTSFVFFVAVVAVAVGTVTGVAAGGLVLAATAAAFKFDEEAAGPSFELGLNAVWLAVFRSADAGAVAVPVRAGAAVREGMGSAALLGAAVRTGRFGGAIFASSLATSVCDVVRVWPAAGRAVDDVVGAGAVAGLPSLRPAI
jgi:hypothetical protein